MIDLDGTLVHSAPEIARGINAMLVELSLPTLPAVQIEAYIGDGAERLIKRALTQQPDHEPDSTLFVQAKQLFFTEYAKVVAQSQPYPGVVSALQALKSAGYRLACVTNKPQTFTQKVLTTSNLLLILSWWLPAILWPKRNRIRISLFIVARNLAWHITRQCW